MKKPPTALVMSKREKEELVKHMSASCHDPVNQPRHYTSGEARCTCGRPIEPIDIARHLNFNIGNAIKYLWRYEMKNGIEDLEKAIWYIKDQIKLLEFEA